MSVLCLLLAAVGLVLPFLLTGASLYGAWRQRRL